MQRILVFGKTGQLARCLAETAPAGTETTFLDRQAANFAATPNFRRLLDIHTPDAVILAAAYTAVEQAEDEPETADRVNAVNPARLGDACRMNAVPIVHFSTDYVFNGRRGRPLSEEDTVHPLGAYGRSKLSGEVGLLGTGAHAHIFRTSWVFSIHRNNFLTTMLRLGAKRSDLRVVADQFGTPTSAHTLAEAVWKVIPRLKDSPRGIYHLAGRCDPDEKVSWHAFAEQIFRRAEDAGWLHGVRCEPILAAEYPTKVDRPSDTRLDCTKFERVFGYALPHWSDGVTRAVASLVEKVDTGASA
jgi:dTDP-4-dehydrorhamnose reductase